MHEHILINSCIGIRYMVVKQAMWLTDMDQDKTDHVLKFYHWSTFSQLFVTFSLFYQRYTQHTPPFCTTMIIYWLSVVILYQTWLIHSWVICYFTYCRIYNFQDCKISDQLIFVTALYVSVYEVIYKIKNAHYTFKLYLNKLKSRISLYNQSW